MNELNKENVGEVETSLYRFFNLVRKRSKFTTIKHPMLFVVDSLLSFSMESLEEELSVKDNDINNLQKKIKKLEKENKALRIKLINSKEKNDSI